MSAIVGDLELDPIPFYNVMDYIPLVSEVSGIARTVFGLVETFFGILILPFEISKKRVTKQQSPLLLVEGISNIVRGDIAMQPFIGNLVLYLYDGSGRTRMDIRRAAGLSF